MAPLKAGDDFPEGVTFTYIPPAPETSEFSACGMPIKYNASKEFKNKKVVLFALPGAFTPTCSASHVPGYIAKFPELKAKGVDQVICLAYNDPFVMSGWGKANGVKDESIVFASDEGTAFSKEYGWVEGERTNRYGMIIDHGKVIYSEVEPHLQAQEVSTADAALKVL
ncbi:peroxiredoxin pmp20 [Pestalotiopsis fici W106-1]|uniref:Thioredoxin peroxidase n=1 Tax=Pestalotiopsis fici (strain W106-1 / CGMCC3.15140) TaxID=1229662 RepID=W3WTT2_PESFW|nr:peroxiredoxin pmp20 [Pestalotiopsis fici W106-1]ETS76231.1 peroxiredoxin pmp20 [Pestalotiopsis fici W106-1]